MARRWYVPLLALPVAIGTLVAVLVGVASASPGLAHPAPQPMAVHAVSPGSPMIGPSGATQNLTRNGPQLSFNWAGYAVKGSRGAFHSVSSNWIQPAAHCRGVTNHRYAAFWVGLDGFLQNDHAVEQTGADTDCVGRTPSYYGWVEMFPAFPVLFRNKMGAGDHMSASVTFRAPRTYVLVLTDHTRRWSHTTITNATAPLPPRTSAEIIAEAPTTNAIVPLANFGTMRWTGSSVNGIPLRRERPIRIVMVQQSPAMLVKCQTSLIGSADAFTNTWVRAL
jgi:Peptidase A4 family